MGEGHLIFLRWSCDLAHKYLLCYARGLLVSTGRVLEHCHLRVVAIVLLERSCSCIHRTLEGRG